MLGEQLAEDIGQITGTRVLPSSGEGPRLEMSFQADGTILGIHYHEMATYEAVARPDGTLFGEGQGLLQTEQGDVATWRGSGVGTTEGGQQRFRGAIYFQTASAQLRRLNSVACVFEYEADESGKTTSKVWEWK